MFVTYISAWQKLFVNAQNIKGKNAVVKIYDLNGRVVFAWNTPDSYRDSMTHSGYFTQDVDCNLLAKGMYVVSLTTDKEMLNKKFVKD